MMSMKWTKSAPTRPGFYYWQGPHMTQLEVALVQVSAFKDPTKPLEASELREDSGFSNAPRRGPVWAWGGRWAGPLPQPFE